MTKSKLQEVLDTYGELPLPEYIGEDTPAECVYCGEAGAKRVYLLGYLEGKPFGFTACDNICAGFMLVDLIEIQANRNTD